MCFIFCFLAVTEGKYLVVLCWMFSSLCFCLALIKKGSKVCFYVITKPVDVIGRQEWSVWVHETHTETAGVNVGVELPDLLLMDKIKSNTWTEHDLFSLVTKYSAGAGWKNPECLELSEGPWDICVWTMFSTNKHWQKSFRTFQYQQISLVVRRLLPRWTSARSTTPNMRQTGSSSHWIHRHHWSYSYSRSDWPRDKCCTSFWNNTYLWMCLLWCQFLS